MENKDLAWKDGYDIAAWLLAHREGLEGVINERYVSCPTASVKDHPEAYVDGILAIIRDEIKNSLNLDPETINLTVVPEFVSMIYGEEFFKRQRN